MKKPAFLAVKGGDPEVVAEEGRSLWDVINDLGMGWFQILAMIAGGSVFLTQGVEIQTITMITLPVADDLGLNAGMSSSLTSVIYVGVVFGGFLSGILGDTFGRKVPIIVSFGALSAVALISAAVRSFGQLLVLRIIFGIFYGMSGPCWNTMASEITPAPWRMVLAGFSQILFEVGELYSIGMMMTDDTKMVNVSWRWQLVMSALPAIVCFVFAMAFLDETPAFLAMNGKLEKARQVLERIRSFNRRSDVSISYTPPPRAQPEQNAEATSAIRRQVGLLLSRRFLLTTLTLSLCHNVANFVFYGNLYVFPQCLGGNKHDHSHERNVQNAANLAHGVDVEPIALNSRSRVHALYGGQAGIPSPWASFALSDQKYELRDEMEHNERHRTGQGQRLLYAEQMSATSSLAFGVFTAEIPSVFIGATLGSMLPRRVAYVLFLVVTAVASLVFGFMVDVKDPSSSQMWLFMCSYTLLRFAIVFGFIVLWQISAELFPTSVRATGCAVAFSTGRVGSICAPPVYEAAKRSMHGRSSGYFILCAILCAANVLPILLIEETKGKNMSDDVEGDASPNEETVPLKGKAAKAGYQATS